MPKYYFTFGFGQKYEGGYHVIIARTVETARKIMFKRFGSKWSMQYDEKNWVTKSGKTQDREYNLYKIN